MELPPNEGSPSVSPVSPSRRLRAELLELETLIREQDWLHSNKHEPCDAAKRSIFADFLKQDGRTSFYSCQFDKCGEVLRGQDHAIGHIREHFGYRPFTCDGACGIPRWYVPNGASGLILMLS